MKNYNEVNGTCYHIETSAKVIEVLERARINRIRLRVYYGDTVTGRSWLDEHDIYGYIGRSTGTSPIPLLIYNNRSYGGPGLLDHCIIKICTSVGHCVLYQHPSFYTRNFKIVEFEGSRYSLLADGEVYANGTRNQMVNLCKKLS